MYHAVERSIALWKAQNGPFRKTIGKGAEAGASALVAILASRGQFYIDYTERRCDYR